MSPELSLETFVVHVLHFHVVHLSMSVGSVCIVYNVHGIIVTKKIIISYLIIISYIILFLFSLKFH